MRVSEIELLLQQFSEKIYLEDGYYRVKMLAENLFELSFSVKDACGGTVYRPRIVVAGTGEQVVVQSLLDMAAQPMIQLIRNEENAEELESALADLQEKFNRVKPLLK